MTAKNLTPLADRTLDGLAALREAEWQAHQAVAALKADGAHHRLDDIPAWRDAVRLASKRSDAYDAEFRHQAWRLGDYRVHAANTAIRSFISADEGDAIHKGARAELAAAVHRRLPADTAVPANVIATNVGAAV